MSQGEEMTVPKSVRDAHASWKRAVASDRYEDWRLAAEEMERVAEQEIAPVWFSLMAAIARGWGQDEPQERL